MHDDENCIHVCSRISVIAEVAREGRFIASHLGLITELICCNWRLRGLRFVGRAWGSSSKAARVNTAGAHMSSSEPLRLRSMIRM